MASLAPAPTAKAVSDQALQSKSALSPASKLGASDTPPQTHVPSMAAITRTSPHKDTQANISVLRTPASTSTTSSPNAPSQLTPNSNLPSLPAVKQQATPKKAIPDKKPPAAKINYSSREFARSRVLQMRTAHKMTMPMLDRTTRQRVAVERAGELARVINGKLNQIDNINRQLIEARHRLSDARMATRPAYDVRYVVDESGKVSIAQICIMAIISGALLQLLV